MAKVKNVKGTSDHECKCGTWLDHWKHHSNSNLPATCVNIKCYKTPAHGGHVRRTDITNSPIYIIPICEECNKINPSEEYTVADGRFVLEYYKDCAK